MKKQRAGVMAAGLLVSLSGLLNAFETQTFHEAVLSADQDNTLFEISDGSLSNGAGAHLFAGRTQQAVGRSIRRALLSFDLSSLPPGATVVSAELRLRLDLAQGGSVPMYLHRVTSGWGEGSSDSSGFGGGGAGAIATTGDATWLQSFYDSVSWGEAGGDYDCSASAGSLLESTVGFKSWRGPGLLSDVQLWLAQPAANFGWVVVADEAIAPPTAMRFASRTNDESSWRPQLVLIYTTDSVASMNAPRIESVTEGGGDFSATLGASELGKLYYLERSDDLKCWMPVLSANGVVGTGGALTLTATGGGVSGISIFRVRVIPEPPQVP
jgi:hypothetical protein